jgi:hypothetical protein
MWHKGRQSHGAGTPRRDYPTSIVRGLRRRKDMAQEQTTELVVLNLVHSHMSRF